MRLRSFVVGLLTACSVGGIGIWYLGQSTTPVGIVVPHHDMVASVRRAYLKTVAETVQPKTIILISPDHFNHASKPIVTTDRTWTTSKGDIDPAEEIISAVSLNLDDRAFDGEHGVTSLLLDIKTFFPESTLVPILVNRRATYAETVALTEALYTACRECLLISSVDFSHTSTALVADLHDRLTLRGLMQMDTPFVYTHAEVDSPESLVALMTWAEMHDAPRFSLFEHTNSGFLTGAETGEMTTHMFGGYSKGKKHRVQPAHTFMIGGDTMFARGVARTDADLFRDLGERFFWGVDTAFLNLEGLFATSTDYALHWDALPPRLLFQSKYVESLRRARVTHVSLANNHADDGLSELTHTRKLLTKNHLTPVGDPNNDDRFRVVIDTNTDRCVAYAGITLLASMPEMSDVFTDIPTKCAIVAYMHWGSEYSTEHTAMQEQVAHDLIDAGADLVVGSHPHVVQDVEVYKGVPIVYSLGNFLFDQGESNETQVGAVVGGEFTNGGLELFLMPIRSYLRPSVFTPQEHTAYVDLWTAPFLPYKTEKGTFIFPKVP